MPGGVGARVIFAPVPGLAATLAPLIFTPSVNKRARSRENKHGVPFDRARPRQQTRRASSRGGLDGVPQSLCNALEGKWTAGRALCGFNRGNETALVMDETSLGGVWESRAGATKDPGREMVARRVRDDPLRSDHPFLAFPFFHGPARNDDDGGTRPPSSEALSKREFRGPPGRLRRTRNVRALFCGAEPSSSQGLTQAIRAFTKLGLLASGALTWLFFPGRHDKQGGEMGNTRKKAALDDDDGGTPYRGNEGSERAHPTESSGPDEIIRAARRAVSRLSNERHPSCCLIVVNSAGPRGESQ